MIMNELRKRAIEVSPFCVGIDLRAEHVPQELRGLPIGEQFVEYAKEIIAASKDYAACYKMQIACYECYGLEGLTAYKKILENVRSAGHIAIADIKRGDIGSTAEMYAQGHFEGDFEADILTLNAYMGHDAVSPYAKYVSEKNKGAFILGKTSNPGSRDFQDLKVGEKFLYEHVIETVEDWNRKLDGYEGFGGYGVVIGVNNADDIALLQKATRELFMLIPGYGAQGAKIEDIAALIRENKNGVVNVSRGLTANIQGDFRKVLKERAITLAGELRECFK